MHEGSGGEAHRIGRHAGDETGITHTHTHTHPPTHTHGREEGLPVPGLAGLLEPLDHQLARPLLAEGGAALLPVQSQGPGDVETHVRVRTHRTCTCTHVCMNTRGGVREGEGRGVRVQVGSSGEGPSSLDQAPSPHLSKYMSWCAPTYTCHIRIIHTHTHPHARTHQMAPATCTTTSMSLGCLRRARAISPQAPAPNRRSWFSPDARGGDVMRGGDLCVFTWRWRC
jgi:hypothetical protein